MLLIIDKLFYFSMVLFLCSINLSTEQPELLRANSIEKFSEKRQLWLDMEEEVSSWVDGLGKPIDPGIRDTVIVLNLLCFKTNASCEGHIDWGEPYPWVVFDVKNRELVDLMEKQQNIRKKTTKIYENLQRKHESPSENETNLLVEMRAIDYEIEKVAVSQLIALKELLEEYYKIHETNPDRMIVIRRINPTFIRLESLGGDWHVVRSDTEKSIKLKEYQEEMRDFTEFLMKKYYNQNNQMEDRQRKKLENF